MRFFLVFLALVPSIVSLKIKDIKCSAVGIKNITISWQAMNNPSNYSYSVYVCKSPCRVITIKYSYGCSINSTKSNAYSCNIANVVKLDYPSERTFQYFIKVINGATVEESKPRVCDVSWIGQCSDPIGLTFAPSGERSLTLTWQPPTDMGEALCEILCYRIVYGINGSINKLVKRHLNGCSFTMNFLLPFTTYSVSLQCSLGCSNPHWSNQVGPIITTTLEEIPQGTIIFQNYESHRDSNTWTRNVTVYFKLPPKEKWNGNIVHIRVYNCCTKHSVKCESVIVPPTWKSILFPSLRCDEEYILQAEYCNTKGCSQRSMNLTIGSHVSPHPSADTTTTKQTDASEKRTIIIAVVIIVSIAFIAVAVLGIVWRYKPCSNHSNQPPLQDALGELQLDCSSDSNNDDDTRDQTNNEPVYVSAVPSQSTLNADTTDFQSASARSLNSFKMNEISFADQSSVRDETMVTVDG